MTATTDIRTDVVTPAALTRVTAPAPAAIAEMADTALRVAAGLALVPHGVQKLFGWMGGYGLDATGQFFETQLGFSYGYLTALSAGSIETFGGIALALGLATRPIALVIALFLAVAGSVHIGAGFFWTNGGWEYAALWAVVAAVYAVKGGGRYSLDAVLTRR
ncbi:MAG: DoxX family protein [Pseudomonadota bacterium]